MKVIIVDDHPVVRNGIRAAFERQPDIEVVGEARDGVEAEALAIRLKPHVIIMDLYMPVQNGIETMLNLKRKLPDTKVLFLTVSDQEDDLVRAVRFGADGYLLKKSDMSDVIDAVRRVEASSLIELELDRRSFSADPFFLILSRKPCPR